MGKPKKTKLTPEFWRRDAEQRREAERLLERYRRRLAQARRSGQ